MSEPAEVGPAAFLLINSRFKPNSNRVDRRPQAVATSGITGNADTLRQNSAIREVRQLDRFGSPFRKVATGTDPTRLTQRIHQYLLHLLGIAVPRDQAFNREKLDIAVIGSGVAGLSAAWLLNKSHRVTVFEKDPRSGGHSNTVDVITAEGEAVAVDTGFIVYNQSNYPNLVALFEHLGVGTHESDMSFAVSLDRGHFEYSGTDLNGLLGQRRNILNRRFWQMLRDLIRFYREAPALLADNGANNLTLGEYLDTNGYGSAFVDDHLLPMGAAIWSTGAPDMRAYPARSFIRFFVSHGLLDLTRRPQWRTVSGGSRSYVRRLVEQLDKPLLLGTGVRRVWRRDGRVMVETEQGAVEAFDHVVIATHGDQAAKLLADADSDEHRILSAFRCTPNRAVLHSDPDLMPKRRRVWSSWNYIGQRSLKDSRSLCVTYWMNRLQGLESSRPLFVTLNPVREPSPALVLQSVNYEHPVFDSETLTAQSELWRIQGRRGVWFCGSYAGYGFHEDALQSGLAVAESIGNVRRPWRVVDESGRIFLEPARAAAA